jgi:fluoride exporter
MQMIYVMAGGSIGALLRYIIQSSLNSVWWGFPLGTFVANIVGSFVIGLLFPLVGSAPEWLRPFAITGFLGAFTTMSSYSLEVVTLVTEKRYTAATLHWAGGALLCVIFCALGVWASNRFIAN